MELVVFALGARGERRSRGDRRSLPEHRHFLVDEAQLTVFLEERFQRGLDLLAVGAAVIEELDQRHVALRVAGDRAGRILEQLLPPRGQVSACLVVRLLA